MANLDGALGIPSAKFLMILARLSKTHHESLLSKELPKFGLSTDIPMSYIDTGLKEPHPVLSISSFVATLNSNDKMDILLMKNRAAEYKSFWDKWKCVQPKHPVFSKSDAELQWCCPIHIHADEGTSQKKKGLMVISYQGMLGYGSRKRKCSSSEPGNAEMNFIGNSLTTRYVYSVMVARLYSVKKNKNGPLLKLLDQLGEELFAAMTTGFQVTIDGRRRHLYLIPISFKGDWPALVEVASFIRHHLRDSPSKGYGAGICHLCCGGQKDKPWHDLSRENMMKLREGAPPPWKKIPGLIKHFNFVAEDQVAFFRIDLFHTCHKGIMADIAANTVVFRQSDYSMSCFLANLEVQYSIPGFFFRLMLKVAS